MTDFIPVVCPTHGRAGKVITLKHVDGLILCVAKSQLALYKEHYPDAEYEVHPDSVVGLVPKRQWIYKRFGDVFQVDDDVTGLHDLTVAAGEKSKVEPIRARALIQRLADEARDLGVYLFSFNHFVNPNGDTTLRPFKVTGYAASHFGMLKGSKLFFSDDIVGVDDYWTACLNAYHHRMLWKDMRYGFGHKGTFTSIGGLAAHRTMETEKRDNDLLMKYFGRDIVHVDRKRTPLVKTFAHRQQRRITLPF